ncbi:MAG: hypothetical protein ACRDXB_10820 [Actinomycetes bacterium]
MSDTKSFELFNADIHSARGKDVITVQAPKSEIEVLRLIHGGNLIEGDSADDEIELSASAADEYSRLSRKYRQPGQVDMVRMAFPQGPHDLGRFGFETGGKASVIPQSSVKDHRKAAKAAAKSAKGAK